MNIPQDLDDQLQKAVAKAVAGTAELQSQKEAAQKAASDWEFHARDLEIRLRAANDRLRRADAERDHYMRYSTELVSRVSGAISLLQNILVESGAQHHERAAETRTDAGGRLPEVVHGEGDSPSSDDNGEEDRAIHAPNGGDPRG